MDAKPNNLIVSVVYLLGVVLPGSIVVFFALSGPLRLYLPDAVAKVQPGSVQGWVIFAVAAYVVGQGLYGFGSWFLDNVYDRTYRRYKQFLKGDPKDFVRPLVRAQFPSSQRPSTYSWARAYVVAKNPGSVTELEQIEADFKFFRSLTLVFLLAPFLTSWLPGPEWYEALAVAVVLAVVGSLMEVLVEVKKQRERLAKLNTTKGDEAKPLEQADPSRDDPDLDGPAIVVGAALAEILVLGAWSLGQTSWVASTAFLVGFAVVFIRFCQQRWQRNETTYEYAAAIAAADFAASESTGPRVSNP